MYNTNKSIGVVEFVAYLESDWNLNLITKLVGKKRERNKIKILPPSQHNHKQQHKTNNPNTMNECIINQKFYAKS